MQVKIPYIAKMVYPSLVWDMPSKDGKMYITFDDGPHPAITPAVLKLLDDYNAGATFFCVGDNVKKYPDVFNLIIEKGHSVGNHSFNHLNGWKVPDREYFENIEKADSLIKSKLFRPPYGRIRPGQIRHLKRKYKIIMWSVLSYDFDSRVEPSQCLDFCVKNSAPGSIIVFHDSEKSELNMFYALERFLNYFSKRNIEFATLG